MRTQVTEHGGFPGALPRRIVHRIDIIPGFADDRNVSSSTSIPLLSLDGTLSKEVMPDLLLPNEEGYDLRAQSMEPVLVKLLSE